MLARLKAWAGRIKRDAYALYLAARDPRTPWRARLLAILVAAYALSPIDLIPDFIPVLGYLDDLVILPLGIWAAVRMLPAPLLDELRVASIAALARPVSRAGAVLVIAIWVVSAAVLIWWLAGIHWR